MATPAIAPVPKRRRRPPREDVLEARAARTQRRTLFILSIACGTIAGALHGIANPAPYWDPQLTSSLVALLIPGVGLGILAGPRTWPAHLLSLLIAVTTLTFIAPGMGLGLTLTSFSVLALGYGGLCLWAFIVHGRLYFPLKREADAPPRGGTLSGDGPVHLRLRKPTVTNATPPEKATRVRWWS